MSRAAVAPSIELGFARCARAFEAELDHVYRTLRRLGARAAEAEDLAQDVFLVMWRRWEDFDGGRPLRPWLTGIAHHVALDHFRRHSRREIATGSIEAPDERPGPEEALAAARARALVLAALARIAPHHREILIEYYLEGTSIRQIAEGRALPFFTASARLRRARLRFARAVKQLQGNQVPIEPEALLAIERAAPPLPAPVRERMRARLLLPAPGPADAPPTPRWVPPLAAAGVLAAVVLAAVIVPATAGRGPRPQPTALAVAPGTTAGEPAPSGGPIGRWRFDDRRGSVATDDSGYARHCRAHDLSPGAWTEGVIGGALDLGRGGWLECPLPAARAGAPMALTVAAWVKRHGVAAHNTVLATRALPGASPAHLFWFGFLGDSLRVWSGAWTGWTTRPLPATPGWSHLAFVHDDWFTRLYVDGVLVRETRNNRPRGAGLATGPLTIGAAARPSGFRQHLDAVIDELVVHDRALDEGEIAALSRR